MCNCKLCTTGILTNSLILPTNLITHLKSHHSKKYDEFVKAQAEATSAKKGQASSKSKVNAPLLCKHAAAQEHSNCARQKLETFFREF